MKGHPSTHTGLTRGLLFVCLLSLVFIGYNGSQFIRNNDLSVKDPVTGIAGPEGISAEESINMGYFSIPFSQVYDKDTNDDGLVDRRSYYDGEQLALAAWDTNDDGRHDMWVQFTSEAAIDQEMYDLNGDGAIDTFILMDEGENPMFTHENFRPGSEVTNDLIKVILPAVVMILSLIILLVQRSKNKRLAKQIVSLLIVVCLSAVSLPVSYADNICNGDGTLNEALFELEWQKYSDFGTENQSWESQQYFLLQDQIDAMDGEARELEILMEYDRTMRLELRELKQSLVKNLQANLVRSFIRLSILTADGIKSGRSVGKKYAELFTVSVIETLPEGLSYLKNTMDVMTDLTPNPDDSELAKTVSEYAGNTTDLLSVIDNPQNLVKVAREKLTTKAEDAVKGFFPSVNDLKFSDEELQILRTQNETNGLIDDILMESYKENSLRRRSVEVINLTIADLVSQQQEWIGVEKERVRSMLLEACKGELDDSEETTAEPTTPPVVENVPPPEPETETVPNVLKGIWLGSGVYREVYETTGWDEATRKMHVGSSIPQGVTILWNQELGHFIDTSQQQVTLLDVPVGEVFPVSLDGRQVSFFFSNTDPEGIMDIGWTFNGQLDDTNTVLSGTSVISSEAMGGPLYVLETVLTKQP